MKKSIILILLSFFATSCFPQTSIGKRELPSQTGNSGKFLTTNGSSPSWTAIPTPTYAPGISAALTGSGTVNYVPKYSSSNTFTDSGIYYSGGGQLNLGNGNAISTNGSFPIFGGFGNTFETSSIGVSGSISILGNINFNASGFSRIMSDPSFKLIYESTGHHFNTGTIGIGVSPSSVVKIYAKGTGSTSASYTAKFDNSSISTLSIRDDGIFETGTQGNTSIKIGNDIGSYGTGSFNYGFGYQVLKGLTSGQSNCGYGYDALANLSSGNHNVGIGTYALNQINGDGNIAIGSLAGSGFSGSNNSVVGFNSCVNGNGGGNAVIGLEALKGNGTKNYNVAIGSYAGQNNVGSQNIFIGLFSGWRQTSVSDKLFIDNQERGSLANELTKSLIVGTFNANELSQTLRINASQGIQCDPNVRMDINGDLATRAGDVIALSTNTNNGNYPDRSWLKFDVTADADLTGLANGFNGKRLIISNIGTRTLTLKHLSGSSSSANQFNLGNSAIDVLLLPDDSAELIYDHVAQKWRLINK